GGAVAQRGRRSTARLNRREGEPMTTADAVVAELRRRGQLLASAESLTGGLVAAAFTAVPGVSAVFTSGVVAYTPDRKTALLGVPAELITDAGVVSGEVAAALALGAARVGAAHW